MIVIGIIFLILFAFLGMCIVGSMANIEKTMQLMIKRQDEIIRVIKNSKK